MDTAIQVREKVIDRNDWNDLIRYLKPKNELCQECILMRNKPEWIFPLSILEKQSTIFSSRNFIKSLNLLAQPIIFYPDRNPVENKIIIKYTGKENYEALMKSIREHLIFELKPATIISPNSLSRNLRDQEQDLVRITKKYFKPLGFIKLHMHSVKDFHEYAKVENADLLILPLKDLPDYIQYALNAPAEDILPAAFQN